MDEENVSGEIETEAAAPPPVANETPLENAIKEENSDNSVPLSALQSERAQRQQVQEELRMIKDHLALLQSQQQKPQPPKDDFEGMDEGDVLTLGDFKKLLSKREQQYHTSIAELKISQKYPDYQDVILKHLPEVIKANPFLRERLETTQDYELAYFLAKNSEGYKSNHKKQRKSEEARRIVENSQSAGSLSSLGSTSPISEAKRYKDMSDDDFKMLVSKNMGYAA